ncbi:MAG: hypothetical protein EA355_10870 [Rhodobacteraceae bacterium]|nr:MAG: hypothetical protein EA355_10870 [Paracoccaceae bacterium]
MRFRLLVVSTEDGFIAREPGHPPADWASPEEQVVFLGAVAAADWAVMGRGTHEAAPRPDRRRVIFTHGAKAPEWRAPTQVWLDPEGLTVEDIARLVASRRPLRDGLILGGAAVHDWFHRQGRVDEITLTVEPIAFGAGVPIFSGQAPGDPVAALRAKGYEPVAERRLNAAGTRLITLAATSTNGDIQGI